MENVLTININDYVSRERIQELAEEQVRLAFASQFRKEADVERVLTNLSYEYVFRLLEDSVGIGRDEVERRIAAGLEKALVPDTIRYEVFRRSDAWSRTESPAVKILDECLKDCRPKIEEMVNKIIEEYPFDELRTDILDTIYCCIERMLTKKEENSG